MSLQDTTSGYESTRNSIYAPPRIAAKVVKNYHECALTPQIANSDFLSDEELTCGSKVIFGVEQDLNLFGQETDNNEHPETHSGPGMGTGSMTVCQSKKFEWKISNEDRRMMCTNFSKWEANLRNQIDKGIKRLVDAYSLPKILASAHGDNVGNNAGKLSHSIDLGRQDATALNGNSVTGFEEMILSMREVAQEAGMMCTEGTDAYGGEGANPVIVIPSKLERYALKLMKSLDTCCSDKNAMRTGLIGSIYGFNIISTSQLAGRDFGAGVGKVAQVLLVDPMQVQHAFDVVTNKWFEGKFEDYLVGQFIWETQVYNRYGVVVANTKV